MESSSLINAFLLRNRVILPGMKTAHAALCEMMTGANASTCSVTEAVVRCIKPLNDL